MHQRSSRRSRNTCVPELMCSRDVDGQTSSNETCALTAVEWRVKNKAVPGTLMQHWWERERERKNSSERRFLFVSSGLRVQQPRCTRLVALVILQFISGAAQWSRRFFTALSSRYSLCDLVSKDFVWKDPSDLFICSFIYLFVYSFFSVCFCYVRRPQMQCHPRGTVILFISPNKNEAPRSVFLELHLLTDSLLWS